MDNLLEVIESEDLNYQKLIQLALSKKEAVISADIKVLSDVTDKEQEITSILNKLENKRKTILCDMSEVLHQNKETFDIQKMIDLLSKQPKEQQKLIELRDQLRSTLLEMAKVNEQNRYLIQEAMEMVDFDLTLYKSLRQAPETANYNNKAYNTGDLLGNGGFEARQ